MLPEQAIIVDADVHAAPPSMEALAPFLSEHWREYVNRTMYQGPQETAYPIGAPTSARPDARSASDDPGDTELQRLRERSLDVVDCDYAVLNCAYAVDTIHNPDAATALAQAVNDWLIADWLEQDSRLRASIVVPSNEPELAAREIDRIAGHPGFVQVLLPVRSPVPYGARRFHPIFEAAARHDIVVGLHYGGMPGNPPSSTGWPSFYIEEYAGMPHVFQTQLMSLVVEGVFDRFPGARVALIESGFSWLPPFLWRFDKDWKGLRRETPWNKHLPSAYVRDHVRVTLQPFDAPREGSHFLDVIEQLGSEELLMFSTDYPHWHYDCDAEAFPLDIGDSLMRKILGENARAFYRLQGYS